MSFQIHMCCLCLNVSTEKLHHLNEIGDPSDVSYYEKINSSLSKLDFKNEYAKDYVICKKCCSIIDNIYEFHNSSIKNIGIMTQYMTLLSSSSNKPSKFVISELSDCYNAIINNKEFFTLKDKTNNKVTDAIVHNNDQVCETKHDDSDIILHPFNAYVSAVEIVNDVKVENNVININKVVPASCADAIDNKEEVDIKIEEPFELADLNNTLTYSQGCIKLEDVSNSVTDERLHDTLPVIDTLQANDGEILRQPDDGYVVAAKWVNDFEDKYNDGKVVEEFIERGQYEDGTPDSADHINAADDASQYEATHGGENSSISDTTNIVCNDSYDLTELIPTGEQNRFYVCDICVKKFSSLSKLLRHRQIHTGEKAYVCDVCNKRFTESRLLVNHKRIHTGEKPYVCEVCNKGFTERSTLINHKRVHTGEKPYVCEVCHKRFTQNSGLAKHKLIHKDLKPYACDVCNKGYSRTDHLIIHKRMHTGEKPYVCDVCDKRFTASSALAKHKNMHSSEKPYECEVCNKGFSENSTFLRHKSIHTGERPYVCDVCNKGFTGRSVLAKHKHMHTNEKPYVCEVCNKGFIESSTLLRHKSVHTGEKPYVCEVCNKRFTRNSGLVKHKCMHTGEKP